MCRDVRLFVEPSNLLWLSRLQAAYRYCVSGIVPADGTWNVPATACRDVRLSCRPVEPAVVK